MMDSCKVDGIRLFAIKNAPSSINSEAYSLIIYDSDEPDDETKCGLSPNISVSFNDLWSAIKTCPCKIVSQKCLMKDIIDKSNRPTPIAVIDKETARKLRDRS
jgi:ATP-dependent helicase YprA (DUF1998 family)